MMGVIDEPLGVGDLEYFDLGGKVDGEVFRPPMEGGPVAAFTDGPGMVVRPGYVEGGPMVCDPMAYRRVLTRKLDTLESFGRNGTVEGLVVVAPVYAVPESAQLSADWSLDVTITLFQRLGRVAGWVTLGHEDGSTWAAGLPDPSCGDRLKGALAGRSVQAEWRTDSKGRSVLAALYVRVEDWAHPHATSLTKGQLLAVLTSGPLGEMPDDTPVVIEKDGESLSPLASVEAARYLPDTTWSGAIENDDRALLSILLGPVN